MTETESLSTSRRTLTTLLRTSGIYLVLGLAAGLFYREFTKANGFEEGLDGQLAVTHTHLLTLGLLVNLIVLALEKSFRLSTSRLFRWFFWIYNIGLVVTVGTMVWHGMLQVLGVESSKMIAGIAGAGHMLLGAGLVLLLLSIRNALRREAAQ